MDEQSPTGLMYGVETLKQELEYRASTLLQAQRLAFLELSIRKPRFSPFELGIYQAVSWLYCYYYEGGRVSFPFLLEHLKVYGLDNSKAYLAHYKNIRHLRTQMQHNLDVESSGDLELQLLCNTWYLNHCGSAIPGNEEEWRICLISLLSEAQNLLHAAIDCIREIERDDSRTRIVERWLFQLKRYHPPYEYENLIAVAAKDMGQEFLDPIRICDRFYDKWSKELGLRTGSYDFEVEARKLIEHTLLTDAELPLPITGNDIISYFDIPPGPQVGSLLKKARVLYNETPCSKEILIKRLAASQETKSTTGSIIKCSTKWLRRRFPNIIGHLKGRNFSINKKLTA